MTPSDHLDGEIRRALQELGEAAGVARPFSDLGTVERRLPSRPGGDSGTAFVAVAANRRRRAVWLAPAAALLLVGLAAVVVAGGRGDGDGRARSGSTTADSAPTSTAASCTGPSEIGCATPPVPIDDPSGSGVDSPLAHVVNGVLPAGFTLLATQANPLHAIAYAASGLRLDVSVDLDADRGTVLSGGSWVEGSLGMVTTDGTRLLTSAGDVVAAELRFGDGQMIPSGLTPPPPQDVAAIVTAVGEALGGPDRDALVNMPQEWVGATGIGEDIDGVMGEAIGDQEVLGTGSLGAGRGWITMFTQFGQIDQPSVLTVAAVHTDVHLTDGTADVAPDQGVARRWVNGWQLVVTASGGAAVESLADMTDAVAALLAAWTAAPEPAGCGTYTVVVGDDLAGIADKFGGTVDELLAANGGLETLNPGDVIRLPCTPASIQQRSTDVADLTGFADEVAPTPTADFTPSSAILVASATDVWVVTGGSGPIAAERPTQTVGKIRIDGYDRATRSLTSSSELTMGNCPGVIEPVDDPAAPLDAIPLRCLADGTTGTVDLFNGTSPEYTG